jgi:hypothetical protein
MPVCFHVLACGVWQLQARLQCTDLCVQSVPRRLNPPMGIGPWHARVHNVECQNEYGVRTLEGSGCSYLSGGAEVVLVSAAVAAAAAVDGTRSDVDSDVGKVVSDASSDVESLALGLDAIEIEHEAE